MSFSSENREKTLRFVLTFHGQATDKLPTGYRHITNSRPTGSLYFRQNLSAVCRPTVGRLSTDCWVTDGQLSADCRPTGFLGSSSSQLHILHNFKKWLNPWEIKTIIQVYFSTEKYPITRNIFSKKCTKFKDTFFFKQKVIDLNDYTVLQ